MTPSPARWTRWPLRASLFGSWPRVFVTAYILLHTSVVAGVLLLFFVVRPTTVFRVDALTDYFELVVSSEGGGLVWGAATIRALGVVVPHCEVAAIELPPGSVVKGDCDRDNVHSLTVSFDRLRPEQLSGLLTCADGTRRNAPRTLSVLPERSAARDAVFPISGALQIGRDVQRDTDPLDVDILRSGRVIADTVSYPFGTGRIRVERELFPGDKLLVFDSNKTATDASKDPAHAVGIVLLRRDQLRIVASAAGKGAEISRPGSLAVRPLVFAPSPWERFQAQAEYGVLALILIVALNIYGAFKEYWTASKEAKDLFPWARR